LTKLHASTPSNNILGAIEALCYAHIYGLMQYAANVHSMCSTLGNSTG